MEKPIKYFAHIKAKTKCPECSNPIFINGPTETVFCPNCMIEIKNIKSEILYCVRHCYDNIKEKPMKERRYEDILTSAFSYNYGNNPPKCSECGEKIPIKKLVEQENKKHWNIKCEKCDNLIPVSRIPKWIRKKIPFARITINAKLEQSIPKNIETSNNIEIEGITLSCPKCGASLDVDGTKRAIECKYCSTSVYIPDNMWLRLHPVIKAIEWYVGFTKIETSV